MMRRTVRGLPVLAVAGVMLLSLAMPAGASPGYKIDYFALRGSGCGVSPPYATFEARDTSGRVRWMQLEVLTVDSQGLTNVQWVGSDGPSKGTLDILSPNVSLPTGHTSWVAEAFLYTTSGNPHHVGGTLLDSQTIEFSCPS